MGTDFEIKGKNRNCNNEYDNCYVNLYYIILNDNLITNLLILGPKIWVQFAI